MSRLFNPILQILDNAGVSIDGQKLTFFAHDTTTLQGTFQDAALSLANTNPVRADGAGRMPAIYLQQKNYTILAEDADGNELWITDYDPREETLNAKDFGATGDGSTDDGPALQLWLDELVASGGLGLLPAGTYLTAQELFLRAASDVTILGPGKLKADSALWGATNRIWRVLYILDCFRITLSNITFETDLSAKPSAKDNSKRLLSIGSNTATEDITVDRCKFRYGYSQPVYIESVERSGNTDDDPITAPSTVTTSDIKLLGCVFEDGFGGIITFNAGCDDLQIINTTFRNISGALVKIDGEIRVGGSSVNPNSCPPSRGTIVSDAICIDCDGSELASNGFFGAQERVNGIVMDGIVFTGCSVPSNAASYFGISPGQGEFEVDSVVIRNVLIEGSTYHSVVRIFGAGASEIKSVTLQNFVLKSNTQLSNVALVNLENANCDFCSLDNWEVHDQIFRLINGAPATAGLVVIKNSWVNNNTDTVINLSGPGNLTLEYNDFSYAKVAVEGKAAWHGDVVIRYNRFNSTAATGAVADLEFANNAAGTGSTWDISYNSFPGTPNTSQEKINITGTAVTGSDAVNITYNDLGACVEGIRSVSTGICSHNICASISGSAFIDFVSSATGRGGSNIILDSTIPTIPTVNFTDFSSQRTQTAADGDETPPVAGTRILLIPSNTGATGITQLDDAVADQIVTIIATNATNPSTIADSGNFKLSAAWTPGIDDNITLYTADGTNWREIARVDN